MACQICKGPWSLSKGLGRTVGPFAKKLSGVFAPIPEDFEYEFCPTCKCRNMTEDLKANLSRFENAYLNRAQEK